MQGVFAGYGGNFATIAYNTPDYDKLLHLERNVYQFSGAKNWQMLKELTRSIREGDKIVPFREWKGKAMTIVDEYDQKNLRTEYNAAVAGAQMASKWVGFESAAALAQQHGTPEPLLQYRTQEDARVRETHAALNRITRPVSDNFWKTYYPPNGWNCRCTTVRTTTGEPSTDTDTNRAMANVAPQKGFTTNLAKEGFVFPKDSAYYIGCPPEVLKAALDMLPYERRFETLYISKTKNQFGKNGIVLRHVDADVKASDYHYIEAIARDKADKGHSVEIMPNLDPHDPTKIPLRTPMFDKAHENASPDLRIDGIFEEVEGIDGDGKNTISNAIKAGHQQANIVIINLRYPKDRDYLYRIAKGRLKTHSKLISVEFYYEGKSVGYFPK